MTEMVLTLSLMAVASGTIALMLTASHLTRPMRHEFLDAPFMLGELINCPYCMAFWTALPAAVAYSNGVVVGFLNWLIITGLSHLFIGAVQRLFLFRESENEELRELLREARETIKDLMEDRDGKKDQAE